MKFEVGSWYNFSIEKISDISDKGNHYVLKHESGRKMLLYAQYYVKYNFEIGQTIECRVDKVNCTGQVFLEPRHPKYNEGSIYSFKKLGVKRNIDKSISLLVEDYFDNDIEVFLPQHLKLTDDEFISLKVEKIKKGCPIMSFPITNEIQCSSDYPDTIELNVVAIVSENSEDYYSLEDSSVNIISRLKVKYYSHYGLSVGASCRCKVIARNPNGLMFVEPENPWYKVGETYDFEFKSIEEYINLDGEEVKSLIVQDNANNKCGVTLGVELLSQIEKKTKVRCKVVGFRKGRPQLEIDLY